MIQSAELLTLPRHPNSFAAYPQVLFFKIWRPVYTGCVLKDDLQWSVCGENINFQMQNCSDSQHHILSSRCFRAWGRHQRIHRPVEQLFQTAPPLSRCVWCFWWQPPSLISGVLIIIVPHGADHLSRCVRPRCLLGPTVLGSRLS